MRISAIIKVLAARDLSGRAGGADALTVQPEDRTRFIVGLPRNVESGLATRASRPPLHPRGLARLRARSA